MKILGREKLEEFTLKHADARSWIRNWVSDVEGLWWQGPTELKERYPRASILPDNRFVFDVRGNNYRMLTRVDFRRGILVVEMLGTHAEYDKWNI